MLPILVVKKDNRREQFDAAKIRSGILRACEKRPVSLAEIEQLVNKIETDVYQQVDQEITSEAIGVMVMDGLRSLDEVAYVRFASVYRQFKDVESFMEELQQILDMRSPAQEGKQG
jgi:transcriptional repressor NrdR